MIRKNVGKVSCMKGLSNEMLMDTYQKAVELKLDAAFIRLLHDELERRKLKQRSRIELPF